MCRDKLLSSNSCTANFQLYTQMALRLEENGVRGGGGENGSRFLCLFGGESERHPPPPPQKTRQHKQDPSSNKQPQFRPCGGRLSLSLPILVTK